MWSSRNEPKLLASPLCVLSMNIPKSFEAFPIGYVRSILNHRTGAPRQAWEGAPDARLEIDPAFVEGLAGIEPGQEIWIFTWLHQAERAVLQVHPRGEMANPLSGVFATRSPDRPNPIGLHRATVLSIDGSGCIQVGALEAIDGTPVIDIKPVLQRSCEL
jgi:tRNA-Thr(GGU) m(6)t(6)A37 methyltransferase TsaA